MTGTNILDVQGLRKVYGSTTAVDDVSFRIQKNEIVGLLGPNGAGKTTTIHMILSVLEPTSGTILIEGIDLRTHRVDAVSRTNFAAVYAQVPGNLTVLQNLHIFGLLYGVPNLRQREAEVMATFDLETFRNTKCGLLSSGEQTRVGLAKAFINNPPLLLLDEPTASLDPDVARSVRERITSFAKQGSGGVLWTSHNMQEVTEVCDRVLFLSHGRILLAGDPKTLPRQHGKENLEELFIAVAREPLSLDLAE